MKPVRSVKALRQLLRKADVDFLITKDEDGFVQINIMFREGDDNATQC